MGRGEEGRGTAYLTKRGVLIRLLLQTPPWLRSESVSNRWRKWRGRRMEEGMEFLATSGERRKKKEEEEEEEEVEKLPFSISPLLVKKKPISSTDMKESVPNLAPKAFSGLLPRNAFFSSLSQVQNLPSPIRPFFPLTSPSSFQTVFGCPPLRIFPSFSSLSIISRKKNCVQSGLEGGRKTENYLPVGEAILCSRQSGEIPALLSSSCIMQLCV